MSEGIPLVPISFIPRSKDWDSCHTDVSGYNDILAVKQTSI
jgi:hypothetical protein